MERSELNELWNQLVKHILDHEEKPESMAGFFSATAPVDFDGDSFILAVKTDFSKDYIERHYDELIKQALEEVLGFKCTLNYVTDPTYVNMFLEDQPPIELSRDGQGTKEMAPIPEATGAFHIINAPLDQPPMSAEVTQQKQEDPVAAGRIQPGRQLDAPISQQTNAGGTEGSKINPMGTYNPKFTFKTFVVGESNNFARAAALKVAEEPGKSYNPLFIYGKAGLGKTHLLNAIANYVKDNYEYMRVVYVTSEDFVNDVVAAARYDLWEDFMLKYRAADVLLIDDVQFLEGKESSITALFNTFNALKNNGSAIVLSADRAPKEIDMDERMRSRFIDGLNVEITAPNFEMRYAILQNYIENNPDASGLFISDDVLMYIAKTSTTNIRELDGAMQRICAYMQVYKKTSIEIDEAKELLSNFFPDHHEFKIEIPMIQEVVERFYGITHEEIIGPKRTRNINEARQMAMYLSRRMTDKSFPDIGASFGGRDHATIMHGVKKVEERMNHEEDIYKQIENLTSLINDRVNKQ